MKNLQKFGDYNIRCLVFDWDGTLVSAEQMVHMAYLQTMKKLEINPDWTFEDTHRQNGLSPEIIFANKAIWGDHCDKAVSIFYQAYAEIKDNNPELLTLKPGAREALDTVKAFTEDVKIVLLANKTQDILEEEVFQTGLEGYFDRIVGSVHNKELDKPSPKAFERAVEGYGINEPAEVLYVGDNPDVDIKFADNYGAVSVIVNEEAPEADFADLEEFEDFVLFR